MNDYRVLFQYLDPQGNSHFEFTTVLAETPDGAEQVIRSAHSGDAFFAIVQTVASNDVATGFTPDEIFAARSTIDTEPGATDG
ncbi:hypothetical protein [Agromyces badenianii]|uniref:hypothetical protein n=1 Tax=Agromyces badenianii TaxID=2080742 RepID=UPI000D59A0C1|nr:hypothetical protein [Agromyces badenianii]PWC05416.1 hypothetical protein DCE94_03850 [Agromyces badenianii]